MNIFKIVKLPLIFMFMLVLIITLSDIIKFKFIPQDCYFTGCD
jgi:hypothetical protein